MIKKLNAYCKEHHGMGFAQADMNRGALDFAEGYFQDKPVKVIEIGSYKGINARQIFHTLKVKMIYLIDPYVSNGDYSEGRMDKAQKVMKRKTGIFKRERIIIKDYSEKVVNNFKDGEMDFIYIDGSHEYDDVKKDIDLYFPKLRKGGILAGHDIDFTGVLRAVSEFAKDHDILLNAKDRDWWCVK